MLLLDAFNDFSTDALNSKDKRKRLKQRTIDTYRRRVAYLVKYLGNCDVTSLDSSALDRLRELAIAAGDKPVTIENSISQAAIVFRRAGCDIDQGIALEVPPPNPRLITLDTFDRALQKMPEWLKAFCCLAYATGLRRDDLRGLENLHLISGHMTVRADKTEKQLRYPIPIWCERQIRKAGIRQFPLDEHTIYRNLRRACEEANVEYFTPQDLRVFSADTWDEVETGLGTLILNHSLAGWSRSTASYLTICRPLFKNLYKFPAPPSMLTVQERSDAARKQTRLKHAVGRLSSDQLETLLTVAESMAS